MPFVQRAKEFTSTLRFRLVLWVTLVVFVMVIVTNLMVRGIEQNALRSMYDQFLRDSLEEVGVTIAKAEPVGAQRLEKALEDKVLEYEYRSWFLQIYDGKKHLLWKSDNSPPLAEPNFSAETRGPYDDQKHRIYEKKLRKESGDYYYIRCGFLQLALQEDLDLLNRNILLVSFSILLFAPLGAYIIALRATQPISRIIETTAHLHPSNLKERLPIRGTGDEIDQLSQTINGMLDRLASYLNQNRDFVANAAHELRSPLTAIRSSVDVALNRSRTPDEYAAILSDVMEEIGRLGGLVNRLLILAEGDAGRLESRNQATYLDKIVRESVDMFEAVAESNAVRILIGELPKVMVPGDETFLRQIVRNLIDNAIKYNKNPGKVEVELRVEPAEKRAYLLVKDSGQGIEKEMLPRIFERFYRADKSRTRESERGGYGLGLSICKTIIQALHGEITVESTLDVGSIFTVRLPIIDDPALLTQSDDNRFTTPSKH
jgi:two-component system, OmpR family, heavy metal sensor histidine kinase CusS